MGTKWHVNPETGEPGRCAAEYSCPFGGSLNGHRATKREVTEVYEEFAAGVFDGTRSSLLYSLSDGESEAFSSGDCGRLAEAFRDLRGYPLVALGIPEGGEEPEWQHIAARLPDGRLIDVAGIYTEADLERAWASHMGVPGVVLRELPGDRAWEPLLYLQIGDEVYPEFDARATAERIIATYGAAGLRL